jgi:hypothetical protein
LIKLTTETNPQTSRHRARLITQDAKGAVFITTSTEVFTEEQEQTRRIDISVDESEEQTKNVLYKQASRWVSPPHNTCNRTFQAMYNVLKRYEVVIPFAKDLAEKFPAYKLRARRDFPRLLLLIKASTLLHQFQRERITVDGMEYLLANRKDYELIYKLCNNAFTEAFDALTPKETWFLQLIQSEYGERQFSPYQAANDLQIKYPTVRHYLHNLVNKRRILWNRKKGAGSRYKHSQKVASIGLPPPDSIFEARSE